MVGGGEEGREWGGAPDLSFNPFGWRGPLIGYFPSKIVIINLVGVVLEEVNVNVR